MKLRPTLWRTCRTIASETRLQLLWWIFKDGELCVNDLVRRTGDSRPNTSNQLRALSARGLITPRREKMKVIYRAEANDAVDLAPELLDTLKLCCGRDMAFKTIIHQATAFTHERRIEIVRALNGKTLSFGGLQAVTGISPASLSRHLNKLERRKFIKSADRNYRLGKPGNPLGRTLLKISRTP